MLLLWILLYNVAARRHGTHDKSHGFLRHAHAHKGAHGGHRTHSEDHGLVVAQDGLRVVHHDHVVHKTHDVSAELEKLNVVIAQMVEAIDIKTQECAVLRDDAVADQFGHNEPIPVSTESSVMIARRDLTVEQQSMANLAERAYFQQPEATGHAKRCKSAAADGAKHLAVLHEELERMEKLPEDHSGEVRDRFATAVGAVADRAMDLEEELDHQAVACRDVAEEMAQEIISIRLSQGKLNEALAISTSQLNDVVAKRKDVKELYYDAQQAEIIAHLCSHDLEELHVKLCSAKQTRHDLAQQDGQTHVLLDCEVSEWIPGQCSTSCGGGVTYFSRHIIVQPNGGAACPRLSREEKCGEAPCDPVDCEMGEWSMWSACDKMQTRMRSERVHPSIGGAVCPPSTESRVCLGKNDEACSFGEWGHWSGCSRACGGGVAVRTRSISEVCAKGTETERQKLCNTHECPASPTCAAAAEDALFFILDGSGSLGEAGFAGLKELMVDVLKRVPKAAVMLAGETPTTVSPMAAGTDAAAKVEAVAWPASLTTIPSALGAVASVGARTVVVFTDGEPNSARALRMAAHAVREQVRLVFVTSSMHDVSAYASAPVHDNILLLEPFEYSAGSADLLVTMLCAQLQ